MFGIADAAFGAVGVECVVTAFLTERDLRRHAAWRSTIEGADAVALGAHHVPALQRVLQALAVNARQAGIDQPGAVEFTQNGHDAAGTMHVLEMHVGDRRRDLAQHRHAARQPIDVGHRERHFAFIGSGEQMQHGVGRAAHRDVERHRVFERLEARDVARQRRLVVLLVVAPREIDDQMPGLDEQTLAVGVGGEHRPVARKRQAECLGEAVHRIGGEHARA
ncbi:hypothetical protein BN961_03387 [Afipia felis]|uniref:Uncharacterized protein n=1 Tax=Afipia felis TaxID=1035 RepID=A0A090MRF0_AFIFE|nr:hypothetical protein BN961_03387 [Afipia felis]